MGTEPALSHWVNAAEFVLPDKLGASACLAGPHQITVFAAKRPRYAIPTTTAVHPSQPFASVVLKGSFGSEEPIPQWKANGRLGSRTREVQVIHAQAPADPTTQHGN